MLFFTTDFEKMCSPWCVLKAIRSVKVTDWPVDFTGLSGTLTDRSAKITDCTVTLPAQSVSHHIQSGCPYLGQAGYLLQTGLFD